MRIPDLPQRMRAAQATDYGDIDEKLIVVDGVDVPTLADVPIKQRKNSMIVQTLAVALAPGDVRVLSGVTRELQGPPHMPYIPGGDVCGIVVELPSDGEETAKSSQQSKQSQQSFALGDRVVARFADTGPRGALAEYAIVSTLVAAKVPEKSISNEAAAALISASPAVALAQSIQPGERVLVLGAGGGVGAHLCQILRTVRGASLVVGVSRSPERLRQAPISCHDAIDYTTTDIFSVPRYQREKFDTIVDLALGNGYKQLEEGLRRKQELIVKPCSMGGKYITTVPPHGPIYKIRSVWAALQIFLFPWLWKALISRTVRRHVLPSYNFGMGLPREPWVATDTMQLAASGQLTAIMDPHGPFPFTTAGVRQAFRLQESYHAQGKVVILVNKDT